jgi:hypothetical protein
MDWWGWASVTLGGVVLVCGAVKAVRDVLTPAIKRGGRLKKLEENDKKHSEWETEFEWRMGKRDAEQEATNQAILKGLVALINHGIDGNSIEGLRKTRNTLVEQIIER